jgi:hypothetical protein
MNCINLQFKNVSIHAITIINMAMKSTIQNYDNFFPRNRIFKVHISSHDFTTMNTETLNVSHPLIISGH